MIPTRADIDEALDDLDAYIAGSAEGAEEDAYVERSWWFHHEEFTPEDVSHVVSRLSEIRSKYGFSD